MSTDEAVLFNNNLTYTLPVPSSVTVNKTKKRSYFQNRTYGSGQTMVCTLNSGSSFIDLKNSNLIVKIKVTSTNVNAFDVTFGEGSAMNMVENIRINTRSGTQLTNTQKMNAFRVLEDVNCESENWFNTVGEIMGYKQSATAISSTKPEFLAVIPLKKLHPFFDPEGGVMGPPQLFSSCRIEIDLATLGNIFRDSGIANTDVPTDYSIEDIYFDLECVELMDSAQSAINTTAQKKSLEFLYRDIFTSRSSNPSNSSAINVDVNKSVSYAEKVMAVIQTNGNQNNISADSYVTPYLAGNWWVQLGSNQYPSNQKIADEKSAYVNNLSCYRKLSGKCGQRGETELTLSKYSTNYGTYAASLELDTSLALSGMPVTSSRTLRFELALDSPLAFDSTCLVFMTFLSSVRATLTSARVDI
tara:strand:- start:4849 stop:6093 length:1245 start_codon:yes stop_codon:yes gene_type:complete